MQTNQVVALAALLGAGAALFAILQRNKTKKTALNGKVQLPPKRLKYRICVYCGSKSGSVPAYERAAVELGELFAKRGVELVYGGGSIGLMGAIAKTLAEQPNGIVHSVIPKALVNYAGYIIQPENCIVTRGMHDRKQIFHDLCDAFIAMPGGLGTVEELMETATWAQIGVHNKPFGVLNVDNFYGPLREMFAKQIAQKFLDPCWEDGGLVFRERADELLDEILRLVDENKASASQIPAHEWDV